MREASILVVGGGIAGMTAAVEAAEAGYEVILVEREPYLGGRVAAFHKYFPKLCPPACGLEINFQRIRKNARIKYFTLAEPLRVAGGPGNFDVTIGLNPRYVDTDKCTACNECVAVCPVERPNSLNYGMDRTKAIYLPHLSALPMKHAIDDKVCPGSSCAKCVAACKYDAIDLNMKQRTITLHVGAIVLATGWKPYNAARMDNLGFGKFPNVITNVMMERLAAIDGPTRGQILRPSDGQEVKSVAFVQCAGSRDENHLAYCSGVCCLASLKQATYVRERYPESKVDIYYIDVRTPGTHEDFLTKVQADSGVTLTKGKVAKIEEDPQTKDLFIEVDDTLTGSLIRDRVNLVVLASGMVPESQDQKITGLGVNSDQYGFIIANPKAGVTAAGVAKRPMDVSSTVRDGTAAALKAIQSVVRS